MRFTIWRRSPDRVGFENDGLRKRENRSTRRKTFWSKDEKQQQTQPTYDAESGNRTRAALVGGECSHHCAMPTHRQFDRSVCQSNRQQIGALVN